MAVPILGEKVGPRRWAAIFVGLVGVLVVLRPTGQGMMTLGGLAILGAAVCYAASAITVRVLAQRDSTQAMVFWLMVMLVIGGGALSWHEGAPIQGRHWGVIAGTRLGGTLAPVALTEWVRSDEGPMLEHA